MSFFNKVKAGVSEAGNKAKTVVEINRLKLQNNSKQNDIDQQYQVMGKLLFEAVTQGAGPLPSEQIEKNISRILELKSEIEVNLQQIAGLSDVKHCKACGGNVAIEARFCPSCGSTFEAPNEPIRDVTPSSITLDKKE
ncbi:zinc ribbon domain-containing protein [Paenibacillus sp. Marseille-Q9583]